MDLRCRPFRELVASRWASRRSQTQQPWGDIRGDVEYTADELPSPLGTTLSTRRREVVHDLLLELPEEISESLAMHFVLGYTVEEIAAAISVSRSTVWSRLRRGERALRRRLQADSHLPEMLELWT